MTSHLLATLPSRNPVLQVTGLTKTFGQGELAVTAVADVDLDVHAGEVVLIMGPSGSGKTTLLLMLGAMLRPTAGAIQVAGLDLARAPERRLPGLRAHRFGFIFQDFNLLSALNAAENVELACNLAGVTGHAARQRARALLERVGLGHRLGFRPEQLSGGEMQRVAIARALANDPPVILADEPTANLDSAIGHQVARLLRQLATEDGRAVVIVSHDTRLQEIADRVLWLEDGSFRELATMATDPVCGMTVARHDTPRNETALCGGSAPRPAVTSSLPTPPASSMRRETRQASGTTTSPPGGGRPRWKASSPRRGTEHRLHPAAWWDRRTRTWLALPNIHGDHTQWTNCQGRIGRSGSRAGS